METLKTNLKRVWVFLPEIYFSLVCAWGMAESVYWTIVRKEMQVSTYVLWGMALMALVCLVGQFRWKNMAIGWILGILFGVGSLYMMLAVWSEFREFPAGDPEGLRLLLTGWSIFGISALLALVMPWKYVKGLK